MVRGVVLGWTASFQELLKRIDVAKYDLTVVTTEADIVSTMRERGIDAVAADPATDSLDDLEAPELVLVGETDPQRAATVIDRARRQFPAARIVAYTSPAATAADREQLRAAADHVIDHAEQSADAVLQAASSAPAVRAFRVRRVLATIDGEACVFTHDNPDPDAIASAIAVVRLAEHLGVSASANYFGEITHQSNRALINALDLPLTERDRDEPPTGCDAVILVDHSIPGRNDALPRDTRVDLVFDHHRPSGPVEGKYVDIRESVGATSAILVEYLDQFEVEVDETLATALLYGISTDTWNFSRKVTTLDFRAAAALWEHVDHALLERIEDPGVSRRTLQTIANAITNRSIRGPALAAYVGVGPERDALAQAADLLVQLEEISIVLVYGLEEGTVYASGRARGAPAGFDLSMAIRDAFAQIGSAGGHEEMAGAQIPLGFLGAEAGDEMEALAEIVREVIDERFFAAVSEALDGESATGWSTQPDEPSDAFDLPHE